MEPVDVHFSTPMRDPTGDPTRFLEIYSYEFDFLNRPDLDRYQGNDIASAIRVTDAAVQPELLRLPVLIPTEQ